MKIYFHSYQKKLIFFESELWLVSGAIAKMRQHIKDHGIARGAVMAVVANNRSDSNLTMEPA